MPVFFLVGFLCIIILILSSSGKLKFLSFLEKPTSAMQSFSYNLLRKLPFLSQDLRIKKLKEDSLDLLSKIIDQEKLKRENQALLDQFQTSYPAATSLLTAKIIGSPGFLPGVSFPEELILDKGSKDNLKVGLAVIVKNNLIGVLTKVSENLSKVSLVNNKASSFTVRVENGAEGIVKGSGNDLTLTNVLLSENIKPGELVLTKGDINEMGIGIPSDLVVGKIISVDKNASDLFQKAKLESFVDFTRLSTIFVYMQ